MADPANTPLGQMLLDEITPVVMVFGTPLVEEACLKNGVNFVQMLSPFCVFNNIDGKSFSFFTYRYVCVCVCVCVYIYIYICQYLCIYSLCVSRVLERKKFETIELNFVAVPVRTASDQPYRLHKFKLRLFYASDIRQPNLEVITEMCYWHFYKMWGKKID